MVLMEAQLVKSISKTTAGVLCPDMGTSLIPLETSDRLTAHQPSIFRLRASLMAGARFRLA
jgi:hypothetical protein